MQAGVPVAASDVARTRSSTPPPVTGVTRAAEPCPVPGEGEIEVLEYVPDHFWVVGLVRLKLASQRRDAVIQSWVRQCERHAARPDLASSRSCLVPKYSHHVPPYRCAETYVPAGITHDRSIMAG